MRGKKWQMTPKGALNLITKESMICRSFLFGSFVTRVIWTIQESWLIFCALERCSLMICALIGFDWLLARHLNAEPLGFAIFVNEPFDFWLLTLLSHFWLLFLQKLKKLFLILFTNNWFSYFCFYMKILQIPIFLLVN